MLYEYIFEFSKVDQYNLSTCNVITALFKGAYVDGVRLNKEPNKIRGDSVMLFVFFG